jgi:DNA-binding NtrC family response regulator
LHIGSDSSIFGTEMLIRVTLAMPSSEARKTLRAALRGPDVELGEVGDLNRLWQRLKRGDIDFLVLDAELVPPPLSEWITSVLQLPERPEIVLLTGEEDAEQRAALLAAGCRAVLGRELPETVLGEALRAFIRRRRREATERLGRRGVGEISSLDDFISASISMQQFMETARKVVASGSSLLLLGETGVGKERLAEAIHHEGPRAQGPFMAVNCGALPETLLESELFGHEEGAFTGATRTRRGYFELAHGGTLFLDEIGEMPLHLQVKLLRVLEERSIRRVGGEKSIAIDVRIMAASNRDLEAEVAAGRFRSDLYFRLAVVTLVLPPLRDRREDIPQLLDSYREHFNLQLGRQVGGVTPRALRALMRYDWPGNVRELINIMERAVLLCTGTQIDLDTLPEGLRDPSAATASPISPTSPLGVPAEEFLAQPLAHWRTQLGEALDRAYLGALLKASNGRVGDAAKRAGLSERSLYNLMQRYGLRKETYRRGETP